MASTHEFFGLRWTSNLFGPVPAWSELPEIPGIDSLCRQHLGASSTFHIQFFAAGAFNRLYTINVSSPSPQNPKAEELEEDYIFRVALPVEPFYKTASEVATLRYLGNHSSIPVPKVIAYDCSAKNVLGFEWILMTKIQGVPLRAIWADLVLEEKSVVVGQLGYFIRQLRKMCTFDAIGSLYGCKELRESDLATAIPTRDPEFVIGPAVSGLFMAGRRKQLLQKNRGPYKNDREYLLAMTELELEDMKLLQKHFADKGPVPEDSEDDWDEDLAEDAPEIQKAVVRLQEILPSIFSAQASPQQFVLYHHDLNHANILINPATLQITGIVDWECIIIVPSWEDTYPKLLQGPELQEQPEPLQSGDTDDYRVERWENWEKMKLRETFDLVAGTGQQESGEEVKRGFREQLDLVELSPKMVRRWIEEVWEGRGGTSGMTS